MKSEASKSKEIKECAKELHFLVDKLYLQFCEGGALYKMQARY